MTHAIDTLEEKLAELNAAFAASMPQRIEAIEAAWAAYEAASETADAFELLYRAVHNLAGSCATYGFAETGERARTLCVELYEIREKNVVPTTQRRERVAAMVAALREGALPEPN